MTLAELISSYQGHPLWQEVIATLRQEPTQVQVTGTVGAQRSLVAAAVLTQLGRPTLLLADDREAALQVTHDLEIMLPGRRVLRFPATARRPYHLETVDNANVVERAEVLHLLTQPDALPPVVVSYGEAVGERVVSRATLKQHTLPLALGDRLGLDFLVEMLEEYGYEQTDFVQAAGEYARRGGLVDFFGFTDDHPLRVEFDGDAIESLRRFDPVDQLTLARLDRAALVPNLATRLMEDRRETLLEYLGPHALVIQYSARAVDAELHQLMDRAQGAWQQNRHGTGDIVLTSAPETLYLTVEHWHQLLHRHAVLDLGKGTPRTEARQWGGQPQPSFRKDFSLLAEHLKELNASDMHILLSCENDKQVRRLQEVFHELAPQLPITFTTESVSEGFRDEQLKQVVYTDHQIFERYHRFGARRSFSRSQALTLKELMGLHPGDFVTHVTHGIGRFAGLERLQVGEVMQEAVKIVYEGGDTIYVNVNALHKIAKYAGKDGSIPKLSKLGSGDWERTKAKVKRRVKELAFDLVSLYARRKSTTGYAYHPDTYLQQELEASFFYEDTPDQSKATEDVKADLEAPHPMDRLVCGDVGFGKTEIAIRAAFKVASEGKQVAVLVPTTILALQHYNTFNERLGQFPVNIDYVNRFRTAKEQKDTLARLADGKLDIVIGTHRLLSKDVVFKDLGLLVIDEEHKFGVGAKEKLRTLRSGVDTLTLTATPIPRTLQFSLLGIRDLSLIQTPPPNRLPVETVVHPFNSEVIRDAISFELQRRGQVFFVHNRIKDLEEIATLIKRLVPDARIVTAHGQMDGDQVEEVMTRFVAAEFDVLVSTTIIESGLDIPNANTIIINQAHNYGLSDLHQMRGRVGRSNRKAFCHLLAPTIDALPTDSRKRLQAMEEFSDLGSGLQIAMRDLDIRGAGDILGAEQSGFMAEVGYDLYHKVLDEAVQELKAEHFPELMTERERTLNEQPVADTQVDTDLEVRIPEGYIPNVAERLSMYRRISESTAEEELQALARELQDRFGLIPGPTLALLDTIRLRETAQHLGFERVALKQQVLKCYFPPQPKESFLQSPGFTHILAWVQKHPERMLLKQVQQYLVLQARDVRNVREALALLRGMQPAVVEPQAVPVEIAEGVV